MFDQPLVFLDVETTGAHPPYDRITEFGLVSVDPGGAREDFSMLLNPGVSIPPVKQLAPVYNRRLRRCVELCSGHWRAQAPADPPRLKMRPWPFGGRVGIREPGGTADSLIVLDRWCSLGTARSDTALQELLEGAPRLVFDLDTYRILTRYLLGSARPRCTVVPLPA